MTGRFPALALAAALAAGGVALAGSARADDEAPPDPAALDLLRKTSVGPTLERWRLRIHGWLEGSVTASPGTDEDVLVARTIDDRADGFHFREAYIAVERTFADGCGYDLGGKVAAFWGTDARFTHSRGLLDDQGGDVEQWDLLEAYLAVRFPVAKGLVVKVGKHDTPMGYEVVEPDGAPLPSRSYLFGYAVPTTHTGVLATLALSDAVSLTYGLNRGWDSWDDANDSLTHILGVTWTKGDDTVVANGIVGAEQPNDDDHLRTVVDVAWTHKWSETLSTVLNPDVGFEEGVAAGDDSTWGGVAVYAKDTVSDSLSATARLEWFRDPDGVRLGAPATLTESTYGLDWTPLACFKNLHLRPEARWDHSYDGPFFDGGRDRDQVSLTLDILLLW